MISFPFRRFRRQQTDIDALYGMIVTQSRQPAFYAQHGVPDTVEGRLEMILLHLILVTRALKQAPAAETAETSQASSSAAQALFDRFCSDMDGNLREMGIGDLTVPKQMKRVAEAFYGHAKAYDPALDRRDAVALAQAVTRNVFAAEGETPGGAGPLAEYMLQVQAALAAVEWNDIAEGRFTFPQPERVPA